jgi:2-polyprenyl-3-methyl-5-hydroxy-6-metoxy-1,4-benzoquinol methylase
MTDYNRIKEYYSNFDEKNRLEEDSGKLEFEISFDILKKYLPSKCEILDLGGGAGKYTIELANMGYDIHLADLSEKLLSQAREIVEENNLNHVKSIELVNAIDLSIYKDKKFDVVILFGPLYHLLEEEERDQCISEVRRVLKDGGLVFASFIPYFTGAVGIVDRLFRNRNQVNLDNLLKVFREEKFTNNSVYGFQEGYYPRINEIETLFSKFGFEMKLMRSIRGFGFARETEIFKYKDTDKKLYDTLIELINITSTDPAMIETGGHAMYIGTLK